MENERHVMDDQSIKAQTAAKRRKRNITIYVIVGIVFSVIGINSLVDYFNRSEMFKEETTVSGVLGSGIFLIAGILAFIRAFNSWATKP